MLARGRNPLRSCTTSVRGIKDGLTLGVDGPELFIRRISSRDLDWRGFSALDSDASCFLFGDSSNKKSAPEWLRE